MLNFTKLSEAGAKITYEIMWGDLGIIIYDKDKRTVKLFDESGKEYDCDDIKFAFIFVMKADFPDNYVYASN